MLGKKRKFLNHAVCFLSGVLILALTVSCSISRTLIPESNYKGLLPCASCPGIEYGLELSGNGRYLEYMRYREHESEIYIRTGTYRLEKNDRLYLTDKNENMGISCFLFDNEQLSLCDSEGRSIETALSEYYVLKKSDKDTATQALLKAHGNEPFWGLTMQPGGLLYFKSLDESGYEIMMDLPVFPIEDFDSNFYRIEYPGGMLELTVNKEICNDGMSDMSYPLSVLLLLQNPAGEHRYRGCAYWENNRKIRVQPTK